MVSLLAWPFKAQEQPVTHPHHRCRCTMCKPAVPLHVARSQQARLTRAVHTAHAAGATATAQSKRYATGSTGTEPCWLSMRQASDFLVPQVHMCAEGWRIPLGACS